MEIILRTEQDRDQLVMGNIIPDYLTDEEKQALKQSEGDVLEVFIPWRQRKWAREQQHYPVHVLYAK